MDDSYSTLNNMDGEGLLSNSALYYIKAIVKERERERELKKRKK